MAKKPTIKQLQARIKELETKGAAAARDEIEFRTVLENGHSRQIGALTTERDAARKEAERTQARLNATAGVVDSLKTQLATALLELATYRGYVQRTLEDDKVREGLETDPDFAEVGTSNPVSAKPALRPRRDGPSVPYRDPGYSTGLRGYHGSDRAEPTPWHNL